MLQIIDTQKYKVFYKWGFYYYFFLFYFFYLDFMGTLLSIPNLYKILWLRVSVIWSIRSCKIWTRIFIHSE